MKQFTDARYVMKWSVVTIIFTDAALWKYQTVIFQYGWCALYALVINHVNTSNNLNSYPFTKHLNSAIYGAVFTYLHYICMLSSSASNITRVRVSLQWHHNGCDGVSNHQAHDSSLNRLFRRRLKKTPKPRVTGLCVGNSPVTDVFPAQMASNAENVYIWRCHKNIDIQRKSLFDNLTLNNGQ